QCLLLQDNVKGALSIGELEAILEDMSDVEDSAKDVVYFPPPVDIFTDDVDINDTLPAAKYRRYCWYVRNTFN
ncbi:hypothetical protein QE152_g40751, partial [Popillia japonica]